MNDHHTTLLDDPGQAMTLEDLAGQVLLHHAILSAAKADFDRARETLLAVWEGPEPVVCEHGTVRYVAECVRTGAIDARRLEAVMADALRLLLDVASAGGPLAKRAMALAKKLTIPRRPASTVRATVRCEVSS